MGFLSLLGLMVTGGIALSGTARNTMSDDREKAKQRELGYITYYDHRLILRRISDDAPLNVVWSEHGKYEVCDKKTYLGKGIYIIDEKVKREWEEEQKRKEQEKIDAQWNSLQRNMHNDFVACCNHSLNAIKDNFRLCDLYKKDRPQYWVIPYLPYSRYGLEAGRANWSLPAYLSTCIDHGYHLYDAFNEKFVFLLRDFHKDKVKGIAPLEETLKYVIDDLEEGKDYLLDLTEEITCFPTGEYNVDAIAVCKKGSQVELPPDHFLVLSNKKNRFGASNYEGFNIAKATPWEKERTDYALKNGKEIAASYYRSSAGMICVWKDYGFQPIQLKIE